MVEVDPQHGSTGEAHRAPLGPATDVHRWSWQVGAVLENNTSRLEQHEVVPPAVAALDLVETRHLVEVAHHHDGLLDVVGHDVQSDRGPGGTGVADAPHRCEVFHGAGQVHRWQGSAVGDNLAGRDVGAVAEQRHAVREWRRALVAQPSVEADGPGGGLDGPPAGAALVDPNLPASGVAVDDEGAVRPLAGVGVDCVVGGRLSGGDPARRVVLAQDKAPPEQVAHEVLHVVLLLGPGCEIDAMVGDVPDVGATVCIIPVGTGHEGAVSVSHGVLPASRHLVVGIPVEEGDDDHPPAVTTQHLGGCVSGVLAQVHRRAAALHGDGDGVRGDALGGRYVVLGRGQDEVGEATEGGVVVHGDSCRRGSGRAV